MNAAVRRSDDRTARKVCWHCHDRRKVYSHTLKKHIDCPVCRRRPSQDRSGLQAVTAAEQRHAKSIIQRVIARQATVLITEEAEDAVFDVPKPLASTDRIMRRWAVNNGSGLPYTDEDFEVLVQAAQEQDDTFADRPSKPPPLDDVTQSVIDQIIGPDPARRVPLRLLQLERLAGLPEFRRSPISVDVDTADFVWSWYCKSVPCQVMAEERGLSPEGIYPAHHTILEQLKARYLDSDHDDLIALVKALP